MGWTTCLCISVDNEVPLPLSGNWPQNMGIIVWYGSLRRNLEDASILPNTSEVLTRMAFESTVVALRDCLQTLNKAWKTHQWVF